MIASPATKRAGLRDGDVAERRARFGWNELPGQTSRPAWEIAWRQARSPMVALLLAAAVGSLIAGDRGDALAIVAILVLNGLLGFFQDYRAEQAMESLRQMAAPVCRVIRNGEEVERPGRELVPGDIVLLDEGDAIPADVRLLESVGLGVQQAALTGEADVVPKDASAMVAQDAPLADRTDRAYAGTYVARGHAVAEVTATGGTTELGRIAELTQASQAGATPLERRMDEAARWIALVALAIVVVIVVAGGLRGEPWRAMFLLGISMAVAAVPEGLPAVVTIALALGSRNMLARRALVRRLSSVETLGSVTVICSDKTGTLTENHMRLVATVPAPGVEERILLGCAALSTNVRWRQGVWQGDPTEIGMVEGAAAVGMMKAELDAGAPRLEELPFDSRRKRMTTLHRTPPWLAAVAGGAPLVAITKGALDVLLPRATLAEGERAEVTSRAHLLATQGDRLLGVAIRPVETIPDQLAGVEEEMVFLGAVALADPPRAEAAAAIAQCRAAGIRPVMITGDHRDTAVAIGERLFGEAPVAVSGTELSHLTGSQLAEASVFARVAPEDKLFIVEALQSQGAIVAMTGDGVNDAPALKRADVGVAMGRAGTDVARGAADIVLLDDNFATIVAAVEEGRRVFANIRKALQYLLAGNMSEIAVMAAAPLLGMPLPLTPLQILWINLVTDGLPALALVTEPPEPGVMSRPPRGATEPLLTGRDWLLLVALKIVTLFTVLGLGWWSWQAGRADWQTLVFQSLAIAQIFLAFSFRSEYLPVWRLGWRSNGLLLGTLAGTFALQILISEIAWPAAVLELRPLSLEAWALAAIAGFVPAFLFECYKALRR